MKHLLHIQRIILITCLICGFTVIHAFGQEGNWLDEGNFDTGWYDNHIGDTPFEISTAKELAGLAQLVRDGKDFSGKVIILSENIELGAHYWTPIGLFETSEVKRPFMGSFNGRGKEISGLSILGDGSNLKTSGLFGYITEEATILNVVLKDVEVIGNRAADQSYTGALVGYAEVISGIISGCQITGGTVKGGGKTTGYTGGLIGWTKGQTIIQNCTISAIVEGGAELLNAFTGALVGFADETTNTISNCLIKGGTVTGGGKSNTCTGGLIGGTNGETTLRNCVNSATVEGGSNSSNACTGGLIGDSSASLIIEDCYNSGSIIAGNHSTDKTGGLVGMLDGSGTTTLTSCYASGTLDGKTGTAGGLVGGFEGNSISIANCLALQTKFIMDDNGKAGRILGPLPFKGGIIAIGNNYALIGGTQPEWTSLEELYHGLTWTNPGGLPLRDLRPISSWMSLKWIFDNDNKYLPYLDFHDAPKVSNPFYIEPDPGPPVPERYYTITLELGGAIHANYRAGELAVAEGDLLHLTFGADEPAVSASDMLFLIDGKEAPFKDLGAGYDFNYMLTGVESNHHVVIALKQYNIDLPSVDGAVTDPAAGTHSVAYGAPFTFTLTPQSEQSPEDIRVYVNGNLLMPDGDVETGLAPSLLRQKETGQKETGQALSVRYTIDRVADHQVITVEGVDPTGNLHIGTSGVKIAMDNGQLVVDNEGTASLLTIYTLNGQLHLLQPLPTGTTTVTLPTGTYIVRAGERTEKVIAHD